MLISIFLIILSCLVIWRASDGFEAASSYLGRNLSDGVRGATINAIGSSMPELMTTLFFLLVLKDKDGFAGGIGTTAGSAVFNGMIIPALVILVVLVKEDKGVEVSKKVILRDGIALLICEFALITVIGDAELNYLHGLVLMSLYVIYVAYMLLSMQGKLEEEMEEEEEEEVEEQSKWRALYILDIEYLIRGQRVMSGGIAWGLLLSTMSVIGVACFLLVHSCEQLGEALGVPIYFLAVILAAAATSVPDTILSIRDAQKGNFDDAVSNALGSNIFDVCFALGFPLFCFTLLNGPITLSVETQKNVIELQVLLFILTAVAFLIYFIPKRLGGKSAFLLLLIYVVFVLFIVGKAYGNNEQISLWLHEFYKVLSF